MAILLLGTQSLDLLRVLRLLWLYAEGPRGLTGCFETDEAASGDDGRSLGSEVVGLIGLCWLLWLLYSEGHWELTRCRGNDEAASGVDEG